MLSDLNFLFKYLEVEDKIKPKLSRKKENNREGIEINEVKEFKNLYKKISFFKTINKIDKSLDRLCNQRTKKQKRKKERKKRGDRNYLYQEYKKGHQLICRRH